MPGRKAITVIQDLNIDSAKDRLELVLDLGWRLLLQKIGSDRIRANKEASLQLHFGNTLYHLGELICTEPGEHFTIELETKYREKNIDITCSIGDVKAAIELKCFRKESNRAKDADMYDMLLDMERIGTYADFQIRRFYCLTDDKWYAYGPHVGHAAIVSVRHGVTYEAGRVITPSWVWKNNSKGKPITLTRTVTMNWFNIKDKWHWLVLCM